MKPAPFDYVAPTTLEEAVSLLQQHGDEAKLLAGGQSLVPMMNFRLAAPAVLVDLNGVSELEHVREEGGMLILGALARHRALPDVPGLRRRCPMLAQGVELIGHAALPNPRDAG